MLNQILEIFQGCGPQRAIPVEDRWLAVFPEATAEDFSQWRAFSEDVEAYARSLATQMKEKQIHETGAMLALTQAYPDLTTRRLRDALNQALYSSLAGV